MTPQEFELKWAFSDIQGATAYTMDRNRPYNGQPHTVSGERGKQIVSGLTMRDIADCIVLGFLDAAGSEREQPIWDDLFQINLDDISPMAVIQNATCHIEKMMGIFPNVPRIQENNQ